MKKLWKITGIFALCLVGLLLLIPFVNCILMAFKDYKPFIGMARSEFVGLDNFVRLFEYKYVSRLFANTAIIGALGLVIGAVYVFVSTLAISSLKNIYAKGALAFLFALPLAIPADTVVEVIEKIIPLYENGAHIYPASAIGNIIYLAPLFVLGALFAKGSPERSAIKLTAFFAAVKLIVLFADNFSFQILISSPSTYEFTETLGTYIYSQGLQSNAFSYGSATTLTGTLMSLIPAAVGSFIIIKLMEKNEQETCGERSSAAGILASVAAVLPLAMAVTSISIRWGNDWTEGFLAPGYANAVVISAIVALFAMGIVFAMAGAVSQTKSFGIVFVCILCLMMENKIGQFVSTKSLELVDTYTGVIISNLRIVPLLALVFAIFIKMRGDSRAGFAVIPLTAGAAFSFAWGDLTAPYIFLNDDMKYPISVFARQIYFGLQPDEFETPARIIPNMSPYVMVPIIVLAICVAIAVVLLKVSDKTE